MTQVVQLVTPVDGIKSDALNLLDEARSKNFETVVIVGYKDGCVSVNSSRSLHFSNLLGAIEIAKHHLLKEWK